MLLLSREQIVHVAVRPTIFGNMMPASFGKPEHQRRQFRLFDVLQHNPGDRAKPVALFTAPYRDVRILCCICVASEPTFAVIVKKTIPLW
jgi:hypothetical protein